MNHPNVVWKRTEGNTTFYHIHVEGSKYLMFRPQTHNQDSVAFGTVDLELTEPGLRLGDPLPVDLKDYRDLLENAYVAIDNYGSMDIHDDKPWLERINRMCNKIVHIISVPMGHA